jgi:hypothetical protein
VTRALLLLYSLRAGLVRQVALVLQTERLSTISPGDRLRQRPAMPRSNADKQVRCRGIPAYRLFIGRVEKAVFGDAGGVSTLGGAHQLSVPRPLSRPSCKTRKGLGTCPHRSLFLGPIVRRRTTALSPFNSRCFLRDWACRE